MKSASGISRFVHDEPCSSSVFNYGGFAALDGDLAPEPPHLRLRRSNYATTWASPTIKYVFGHSIGLATP